MLYLHQVVTSFEIDVVFFQVVVDLIDPRRLSVEGQLKLLTYVCPQNRVFALRRRAKCYRSPYSPLGISALSISYGKPSLCADSLC